MELKNGLGIVGALLCAVLPAAAHETAHADAHEAEGHPSVRAFELASGDVRLRIDGGEPFGTALLKIGAPWRPAVVPIALDELGAAARDWPRAVAAGFAGTSINAVIEGVDGALHQARTSFVLGAVGAQRGDLVITEFMKNPSAVSDSNGEWIEIINVSPGIRQIAGWTLHDGGANSHVIQPNGPFLFLQPGQRMVLGNEGDPALNGGVQVDYVYSSFTLSNGADEIFLTARTGQLVDQVVYDDSAWPDVAGQAASLTPGAEDAFANDDPANWCSAVSLLPSGDAGTPGAANDVCP